MKTNLLRTCIGAVLAATAALAQHPTHLNAAVPFDFKVGNQSFPSGRYEVYRGPTPATVMIRSEDCKKTAIVQVLVDSSSLTPHATSLVFHRYGDTRFLSEIWSPGNLGRRLFPAKQERELAVHLAAPATTSIAAVR